MKKLKKPTAAILMATLIFSNMQLCPIYGDKVENTSKQIVEKKYRNEKYQNNDFEKNYKNKNKKESAYIKNYVSKSKDANTVVNIPDANLKKGIYETLRKKDNETITKGELESLKYLDLWNSQITNLEGIQYCINLEVLYLRGSQISDIEVLSNLIKLRSLDLGNNKISDISALSRLVNLGDLYLSDNNISDIEVLSNMTNLYSLHLNNNEISDISALSGLINLGDLDLGNNEISDINSLPKREYINYLNLSNNQISNIKPLSKTTYIQYLDLSSNQISDITPLLNISTGIFHLENTGIYLNSNPLALNDSKTMEVIQYLKNQYLFVYYDENSSVEEVINIPDINLKKAINEKLGKYSDLEADITKSELETIKDLYMEGKDIKSLDGLQYCINLSRLSLQNCNINDISVLPKMINLKDLDLPNSNISDISVLSEITNLEVLNLSNTNIRDISILSKLINLKDLSLENNNIKDISALSGLINLEALRLYNNNIKDISVLSRLINLAHLELGDNNIKDISVLSGLINLASLDLYNNSIEDISSLSNMTNLYSLRLNNNEISDISALSRLINLESLTLAYNNVRDISALSDMIKLEYLELNNNKISDINPLSNLKIYRTLNLSNNEISDIRPLSNMDTLGALYLDNNKISDISGLPRNSDFLGKLSLSNNNISDIRTLSECDGLTRLNLENNNIEDISALSNLESLRELNLKNNKISDIAPLLNIDGSHFDLILYVDLTVNPIDLNNSKNMEVIYHLEKVGYEVYCDGLNKLDKPVIIAEDKIIMLGDTFNELSGVVAKDKDGIDITDKIEVIENDVWPTSLGVYDVIYKVTDSQGISTIKRIKVTVTKKIDGIDLGAGNGTESKPLEVLLQEENAIDELVSKIESSFEYNIVDEPVIKDGYKIYKIKLNDKTVVANEQVKSNGNSNYIEIKVEVNENNKNLIYKLDKIFIKDNNGSNGGEIVPPNGGDSNGEEMVPPNNEGSNNGGDVISPVPPTIEKPQIPEVPSVPPTQKPVEFNDIKGHWAEETIKEFTDKNFINGYEDNTFKPNNNMTRAEFVKLVNKVFGYTQKGEEQFTDVNKDDWFYDDICIGIKAGYIKGKSKDIFAPNENITREEVAMILTNIMNNKDENLDKLNTFKDGNKTSQWAQSSVEGAIEAGYLNGDDQGLLNPTNNITRAEAISMLSRVK